MARKFMPGTITAGLILCIVTLAAAQFPSSSQQPIVDQQGDGIVAVVDRDLIFPAIRIIRFDNTVARLDTQTGEVSRFNGTLTGTSAGGTWRLLARPVSDSTSGFLDLRTVNGGTFLIDLQTGETWILRRGTSIGSWVRVVDR